MVECVRIYKKSNKEGKMELLQLKYFCDAAKTLNFSKTARKYTVPPSNISQSIKRLESDLGYPLFQRHANKIVLSERGKRFYEKISRALNLINEAANEIKDDGTTGSVTISINTNRRLIMEVIEKFKKDFPAVNIKTAYFGNLNEEDYDIIIDAENTDLDAYEKEILFSEDIALAVNSESHLAPVSQIDIAKLDGEPFITMDDKASMYKLTKEICRENGFEPKIALQSDDPTFVRKCVELGLGVAFAPMLSWKGQFDDSVVLKKTGYKRNIYIYSTKNIPLQLCVKNLYKKILSEIKVDIL